MESVLNRLFDYQRFERETSLQDLIESVHRRTAGARTQGKSSSVRRLFPVRELNLDEMGMLSAAGQTDLLTKKEHPEQER